MLSALHLPLRKLRTRPICQPALTLLISPAPLQAAGRCISRMASRCESSQGSCDPSACQWRQPVCKPINEESCRVVNSNDGQAVSACQSVGVCNTLVAAGATPDSACTNVLKLCPGPGCEVCKAKMVELLAGIASAPTVQCQGDKPALASKSQLCMASVAPMLSSASDCAMITTKFADFEAAINANNVEPFCRSLGELPRCLSVAMQPALPALPRAAARAFLPHCLLHCCSTLLLCRLCQACPCQASESDTLRSPITTGGNDSYAPCMAISTKASALIKSGWFPLAPSTLFYFCMEGHSMDSVEAFERKWAKYSCDPSNNVCCPATKVTPAPAQCSTNPACQPRSACQVVYDNCFNSATEGYSINLMAGKVFATCPAGCDVIASTMQGGSYTPLPIMGADGNITTGICTNKTIVTKCSTASTADSCSLLIDGQQACEFETECKPPAASNFDCSNNPDTCCIASSTPVFSATEASACAAGNATRSAAGLGCAVKKGCIQVVDPCANIVAPWGEWRLPDELRCT